MPRKTKVSSARKHYLNTAYRVRFLIRLSIAIVALGWSGWCLYMGIDSAAWPTTMGRLVDGNISSDNAGSLSYSYQVPVQVSGLSPDHPSGTGFSSTNAQFGDLPIFNCVPSVLGEYSPGSPIPVRYNPDRPDISCLRSGVEKPTVYVVLAIGLFFLYTSGGELRARDAIR